MVLPSQSSNPARIGGRFLMEVKMQLSSSMKGSRDSVGGIPSSYVTNVIARTKTLTAKIKHVLQIGASLCYKQD